MKSRRVESRRRRSGCDMLMLMMGFMQYDKGASDKTNKFSKRKQHITFPEHDKAIVITFDTVSTKNQCSRADTFTIGFPHSNPHLKHSRP